MKDKVVIITGGTSGIGKALAHEFGRKGSKIVITGRRQEELEKTIHELSAQGIQIVGMQADVSRVDDNERMAAYAIQAFGKIDILINNAGISMRAMFDELDLDVVRHVMDINFYGAVYATRFCLPEIKRNRGSVVGISSIAGFRGLPARSGYSASKFALNGFLDVLTACPGFTESNIRKRALTKDGTVQGESPRNESEMMSAEECASHIYNAVLKRKRTLILTTQGKLAVLINKLFPSWADRLVYNTMAKEANAPLK
jgi:dehydrogenase/reductase SDR family member 7B